MIEKKLKQSRILSQWLVWIGGALIVASALLVTLEVLLRMIFNISIGGADELSGYAFGVATTFGFAYALHERAHIRVDVLFNLLPNKLQIGVNFFGLLLLIGFAVIVSFMAWDMVSSTLTYGSRSITPMRTPLAIPQLPWFFGWLFFVITGVIVSLAAISRLLKGDVKGVNELIGIKSIDQQIEDEVIE